MCVRGAIGRARRCRPADRTPATLHNTGCRVLGPGARDLRRHLVRQQDWEEIDRIRPEGVRSPRPVFIRVRRSGRAVTPASDTAVKFTDQSSGTRMGRVGEPREGRVFDTDEDPIRDAVPLAAGRGGASGPWSGCASGSPARSLAAADRCRRRSELRPWAVPPTRRPSAPPSREVSRESPRPRSRVGALEIADLRHGKAVRGIL